MEVISGKVAKAKKVVLYGPEGIGKSTFAAQFPRPIFIDTEGSTTEMDVDRLPKPSSYEMIKQQVSWVKQQGVSRFGTLVIDTIDWGEMLITNSVCSSHGKVGVEDFGFGKGYIYVAEELGRFLNLLSDVVEAGINVVLTAHAQIIKFEQPDEMGAYDRYQLKLGQKTGSRTAPLVKEWADMLLFINYKTYSVATDDKGKKHKAQGGTRTVYATHHPAWDAKNRHGLPDDFPLDYGHIAHIFNQSASPGPLPVAKPSQPEPSHPDTASTPPPAQPDPAASPPPQTGITPPAQADLDQNIPAALRDLMLQHGVKEIEIQVVVSEKGYYPKDTPIVNYDPQFINGVLVTAWDKVYAMIQSARENLPFY